MGLSDEISKASQNTPSKKRKDDENSFQDGGSSLKSVVEEGTILSSPPRVFVRKGGAGNEIDRVSLSSPERLVGLMTEGEVISPSRRKNQEEAVGDDDLSQLTLGFTNPVSKQRVIMCEHEVCRSKFGEIQEAVFWSQVSGSASIHRSRGTPI